IEGGFAHVTIERVAERSGVAKTTIYRHWTSRSRLIFDAFRNLLAPAAMRDDHRAWAEDDVREGLTHLLRGLIRGLTESAWAPAVSTLVDAGDRDPEMRQLIHDFLIDAMAGARILIASARERGDLAAAVDPGVAIDMLVGPVFYRRLVSREPLGPEFAEQVVDLFLMGALTPGVGILPLPTSRERGS
ncbi:MAG: TetR/AcrR family transcriptional regulator, partial [Dehalococcoidia bacterium]